MSEIIEGKDYADKYVGNPPALPGDSKSLTFAGVKKDLLSENHSKFKDRNLKYWLMKL